MPRFRRLVVPGHPHHVTQRGVRRQTVFFEESDYREYLRLAAELLGKSELSFWAYCLMPNHIHAVVLAGGKNSLAKFFSVLHRRYARRTNKKHDWKGHLWQERYFSVVMDEAHTVAAMRYVELNPVRAGLCSAAHEWQWSSARGNLGYSEDPLIDKTGNSELVGNWHEYLGLGEDPRQVNELRKLTRIGRPGGSDAFVESIELKTGRVVQKRKRPVGR